MKPFNGSEGAHETNIASVIDDEDVDDVIRALQDYQKSKQKKMNQIGKQIKKERELNIQNPKIVYFDFARHIKEKQKAE
ncbi:MAG: hypothetical protein LUH22_16420 [Bacteroides sp.]|nr:hypothetical protein [Bacteroides sp.]